MSEYGDDETDQKVKVKLEEARDRRDSIVAAVKEEEGKGEEV